MVQASGYDPDAEGTETKLWASDGASSDFFGYCVAVSGDYAVVGAGGDGDKGASSGSAYIFERSGNTWTQVQKLTASDGASYDNFGNSVAISGDYAVVGAGGDGDNGSSSGSAYIFERSGNIWAQVQKLTASDGAGYDYFGKSVAISGDYVVVGADGDDDNGSTSGSAYIFERSGNTWTQVQKLTASDGTNGDYFGKSVSISGDYVVVGAYEDGDGNGVGSGTVYIFKRSGSRWIETQKVTASDGASGDYFGYSVAISGDYALIGAHRDDDSGVNSGTAYIFQRNGNAWAQVQKLTAGDGAGYDYFGKSVAISGDYAVVGADGDDNNGSSSGTVYIFQRNGNAWTQVQKLTASDGASYDSFGSSVAISGNYTVVGADYDDDNGDNSGSTYIYQISKHAVAPLSPGFIVLSEDSLDVTITSGSDSTVLGCTGTNHVTMQSAARAVLRNSPGNNTITFQESAAGFTVHRSGAAVLFEGSRGTFLSLPATQFSQTIRFNDAVCDLTIEDRQVVLNNQVVEVTPTSLSEFCNTNM